MDTTSKMTPRVTPTQIMCASSSFATDVELPRLVFVHAGTLQIKIMKALLPLVPDLSQDTDDLSGPVLNDEGGHDDEAAGEVKHTDPLQVWY
jgi:hypothetical protein